MAFVAWFCGLPGSGKTTLSRNVAKTLKTKYDVDATYLSMDELRKQIFPKPTYSDEERDAAYRAFVLLGKFLCVDAGKSVLLDGTGHRLEWRSFARVNIPNYFEVYVKCPVEVCIERETKREGDNVRQKLYIDALERLKTGKKIEGLGKVPGVDEPFEESEDAEIVIDCDSTQSQETATRLASKLVEGQDNRSAFGALYWKGIHHAEP